MEVTLPLKGRKGRTPVAKKAKLTPIAPHSTMTVLPPVSTPSPLVSSQTVVGSTTPAQLPGTQQQLFKVRYSLTLSLSLHLSFPHIITWLPSIMQARRGVKRQADTTTPSTGQPSPTSATPIHPLPPLPLIPQRRESTRKVKRPKMDLPGEKSLPQAKKQKPLSVQMKFCTGIIKELFSKKHAVS